MNLKKSISFFAVFAITLVGIGVSSYTSNMFLGMGASLVLSLMIVVILALTNRAFFFAYLANVANQQNNTQACLNYYKKATASPKCPDLVKIVYAYRLLAYGSLEESKKVLSEEKDCFSTCSGESLSRPTKISDMSEIHLTD